MAGLRDFKLQTCAGPGTALTSPKSLLVMRRCGVTMQALYETPLPTLVQEYRGNTLLARRKKCHLDAKRAALLQSLLKERETLDDVATLSQSVRDPVDVPMVLARAQEEEDLRTANAIVTAQQKRGNINERLHAASEGRKNLLLQQELRGENAQRYIAAVKEKEAALQKERGEERVKRMLANREKLVERMEQKREDGVSAQQRMEAVVQENQEGSRALHDQNVFLKRRARARRLQQAARLRDCTEQAKLQVALHDMDRHAQHAAHYTRTTPTISEDTGRMQTVREQTNTQKDSRLHTLSGRYQYVTTIIPSTPLHPPPFRQSESQLDQCQDELLNAQAFKRVVSMIRQASRSANRAQRNAHDTLRERQVRDKTEQNAVAHQCLLTERASYARGRLQEKELYAEDHKERVERLRTIQDYRTDCLSDCIQNRIEKRTGIESIAAAGARNRFNNAALVGRVQKCDDLPGPGQYLGCEPPLLVHPSAPVISMGSPPVPLQETYVVPLYSFCFPLRKMEGGK